MEIPYNSLFLAAFAAMYKNSNAGITTPIYPFKKMVVAINRMLIFSNLSEPLEWVIFSMPNVYYYFFPTMG